MWAWDVRIVGCLWVHYLTCFQGNAGSHLHNYTCCLAYGVRLALLCTPHWFEREAEKIIADIDRGAITNMFVVRKVMKAYIDGKLAVHEKKKAVDLISRVKKVHIVFVYQFHNFTWSLRRLRLWHLVSICWIELSEHTLICRLANIKRLRQEDQACCGHVASEVLRILFFHYYA